MLSHSLEVRGPPEFNNYEYNTFVQIKYFDIACHALDVPTIRCTGVLWTLDRGCNLSVNLKISKII